MKCEGGRNSSSTGQRDGVKGGEEQICSPYLNSGKVGLLNVILLLQTIGLALGPSFNLLGLAVELLGKVFQSLEPVLTAHKDNSSGITVATKNAVRRHPRMHSMPNVWKLCQTMFTMECTLLTCATRS